MAGGRLEGGRNRRCKRDEFIQEVARKVHVSASVAFDMGFHINRWHLESSFFR